MMYNNFYSNKLQCKVKQITIRTAKKLFNQGKEIFLQSSNMHFESVWSGAMPLKKDTSFTSDFDYIVSDFKYYNCDNERGKRVHFFVRCADAA